ncbi:MAG: glycosyltransferase family 4 protein [Oscillospiraceae bacterium]|nr:glycosyltransferase family 4 protein [Oscillospiraceae bacterium]
MKRIALVCPRYGTEVTEGSARYAKQLAEQLVKRYEVEVLTTKAIDDKTWRNWYARDRECVKGVNVRRFNTEREKALNLEAYTKTYLEECREDKRSIGVEKIWIEKQGPFAPDCIRYIIRHRQEYDVIIFVGYMNYLTVAGMPEAAQKAVLVPLIKEDSPYFQFLIFQQMFTMPGGFVFLTNEERMLVRKRFRTQGIPCEVMGTGADIPENIDEAAFFHKYHIRDRYILYCGRIDDEKDCPALIHYFTEYRRRNPEMRIKLVLMGEVCCRIPDHEDIIPVGYVSEQDKYNGIAGAELLVMPSQHENLPEALLSAMALGIPVLVNGACDALKEHCRKSNAGLYYENFFEFEGALNRILPDPELYEALSRNALMYVRKNYEWDVIIERFIQLINKAVE